VISDIDDTIKYSNILSGARSVFFNVFVKELHEILIPGMPEWYNQMWQRGVRFHYVVRAASAHRVRVADVPPRSRTGRSRSCRS
jgi:phosphatidate phosphatase APP1